MPTKQYCYETEKKTIFIGTTVFFFLQLVKKNKFQHGNNFHRQAPSVVCAGPQCKRGLKRRIKNRFTKEDTELS